ncbi:MAG: hypothetical protein H2044_09710 [Rhizobiales bacterium]|nr:hypothetical protein [Hyphomicrobiales bacterium]
MEQTPKIARAQYTWEGKLDAYVLDGGSKTVPSGNPLFHEISEAISKEMCELRPPEFKFAYEVRSRDDKITGHDTAVGFVPIDETNEFRRAFEAEKTAGRIEDRGIAEKPKFPKCSHIKFCVFFPRPWPHLAGKLSTNWRYRSSPERGWVDVGVSLSNHPENPNTLVSSFLTSRDIKLEYGLPEISEPLQQAALEIEFDISDLQSLFRAERSCGFGIMHDAIENDLKRSLCRSGDKKPTTMILLDFAPEFLRRPVIDISNEIAAQFNIEYGGHLVGFIQEKDLNEQLLCLLVDNNDGTHHLYRWGGQTRHSFFLEGTWYRRPNQDAQQSTLSFVMLRNRLLALIDAGFVPEAISLANGFFELACREMLAGILTSDTIAAEYVRSSYRFGYDRCRKILRDAIASSTDTHLVSALEALWPVLAEIYRIRNSYMHSLTLREHDFTRSVDLVRQAKTLLNSLLDAWETNRLADTLESLKNHATKSFGGKGIEIALSAVKRHMDQTVHDDSAEAHVFGLPSSPPHPTTIC